MGDDDEISRDKWDPSSGQSVIIRQKYPCLLLAIILAYTILVSNAQSEPNPIETI